MIRRVLLAIVAVVLVVEFVLAACAATTMAAEISAAPDLQAWVETIQARTHVPGPAGPTIDVVIAKVVVDGLEAGGGWYADESTIRMPDRLPVTLEHELGHAFDQRNLDVYERLWLVEREGFRPGTPWSDDSRWDGDPWCERVDCPNEVFADVYAGCALGYVLTTPAGGLLRRGRAWAWWSSYGWRSSRARYAELCAAIRAFADPVPQLEPQIGA